MAEDLPPKRSPSTIHWVTRISRRYVIVFNRPGGDNDNKIMITHPINNFVKKS